MAVRKQPRCISALESIADAAHRMIVACMEEMDVEAVIARRPRHRQTLTNWAHERAGSKKQQTLDRCSETASPRSAAGISGITACNVQHIEIAELDAIHAHQRSARERTVLKLYANAQPKS